MMTWVKMPFRALAAFLDWWLGELAGLVPRFLRRPFSRRGETIILEPADQPGGEGGRLFLQRGKAVEALGAFGDGLAQLPAKARRSRRSVTLALPQGRAVRQTINLPLAAEENLREVIGFEMDRLTPFRREEVYYDQRVLGRDPAREQLEVELTLSPRATVDGFLEAAEELGLKPQRVDVATGEGGHPLGLDLLQLTAGKRSSRFARAVTVVLLITACGLGAASIAIPLDRKARLEADLRRQVTEARANAAAARELESDMAARQAHVLYVHDLKRGVPSASAVMDSVTRLLPDDTWLYQLRVNDDKVEISGYAPNSSSLIQLFEDAPAFAEARFRAPVTQDAKLGMDRFSLQLRIVEPEEMKP